MARPHTMSRPDPKDRILNAARACFVRAGFERATMQQVAAEAGMSAGNLYRYFDSKDGLVEGLCKADLAMLAASFDALAMSDDPRAALAQLTHRHLAEEPHEDAVLMLQIWSAAVRNDAILQLVKRAEVQITAMIVRHLTDMQRRGHAHPALDVTTLAEHMLVLVDGIIVRRARDPAFDVAAAARRMVETVHMAMDGQIASLIVAADAPSPEAGDRPAPHLSALEETD